MNESDRFLTVLEPPPGGWPRLLARRDSQSQARWMPSWWALATGAAAAVLVLTMFAPPRSEIQMQLTGGRLIGERSEGVGVQLLEGGRAVSMHSGDENVQLYWVEPVRPRARPQSRGSR
jgi:hypothetical protein